MIIELTDTTAAKISSSLLKARRQVGPANGMVFTLIAVTSSEHHDAVLEAALEAGRAHPSRIMIVSYTDSDETRVDAEVQSGETVPGDVITLRFSGELREHADSVVLPLLLPDSPTVVWWPHASPVDLADDPVGALGTRRITDAAGVPDPVAALLSRAEHHSPGDTDLTWTRLTPWRALLAAALDQHAGRVTAARVEAAADNAPAALLRAWLIDRLEVPVEGATSDGPGITGVFLQLEDGEVQLTRTDEKTATYSVPGEPKRTVALRRRNITQLITEELNRLDADDIFEDTMKTLLAEVRG